MSRLINADALVDCIESIDWYHINQNGVMIHGANSDDHQPWYKADDIYKAIEEQPTVDAVPVVRCKDCVWWKDGYVCFNNDSLPWHENDFCSNGRKKPDETCKR